EQFQKIFGFPYVVPVTQGRAAERIWAKLHVKEGTVAPGNMLFPSMRFHIESNGGKIVDVISDNAHDLYSEQLFKGNIDLNKLETVFKEQGEQVGCVYVELCVNSCGGHPVSLRNLKAAKAMAVARQVPLFIDGCRILENSYLIKQREPGYQSRSIRRPCGVPGRQKFPASCCAGSLRGRGARGLHLSRLGRSSDQGVVAGA